MESSTHKFYKVFVPAESSIKLEIPLGVQICLPNFVGIRDKFDNVWQVQTQKVGQSWFFSNGWARFVKDNKLTKFDMLRFWCFSERQFDVKIYGVSGCEKSGVGYRFATSSRSPQENENLAPVANDHAAARRKHQRRKVLDCHGRAIFRNGLAPKPEGIYFVTRCLTKRMNEMYLPSFLMDDENFSVPSKVKLVDPHGHTYSTTLNKWADGRSFYRGGWSELLRKNDITEDDICICKFSKGAKPKYLFVSFLRDAKRS